MGIPDTVVVLLCILGAAASVTIGFAVNRLFGSTDANEGSFRAKQPAQLDYMREVRDRNVRMAFGDFRAQGYHQQQHQQQYQQSHHEI